MSYNMLKLLFISTFCIMGLAAPSRTFATPKANASGVSQKATPFDQSHADLTELLKSVVTTDGAESRVNYKKLRKESVLFNRYLKSIGKVSKKSFEEFSPLEQQAFLINAYNAFTLKLVVDNYPIKSVKKIGGLFANPSKMKFIKLLGRDFSLDELENQWLRKKYTEPRIHFALNCAALGCPALRAEAFTASDLNTQLDDQAKLFLQDNKRNKLDVENKKIMLSKIFEWYKDDFENAGGVQKFVSSFITDDPLVLKSLEASEYELSHTEYDWDLNDQK